MSTFTNSGNRDSPLPRLSRHVRGPTPPRLHPLIFHLAKSTCLTKITHELAATSELMAWDKVCRRVYWQQRFEHPEAILAGFFRQYFERRILSPPHVPSFVRGCSERFHRRSTGRASRTFRLRVRIASWVKRLLQRPHGSSCPSVERPIPKYETIHSAVDAGRPVFGPPLPERPARHGVLEVHLLPHPRTPQLGRRRRALTQGRQPKGR